jgi:tetratricopeptide (TPR) repeat protein
MLQRNTEAAPVRPVRAVVSILAIASCVLLISAAARFGFSRLLGKYAIATTSISAANEVVRLTPSDPDAHRVRAAVLNRLRLPAEAQKELELATTLRPCDDYIWLELGNIRDELGDPQGALAAFDQAVRWAPYYAHTRWQRGNLKLRMGRYDEAFSELRYAARSNNTFLPNLIDLAWTLSAGDAKVAEQLIQVNDDKTRVAFARFLAGRGKSKEAVEQFHQVAASFSEDNRRDLVRQLMMSKAYGSAFEIWSRSDTTRSMAPATVYDGGFEGPLSFESTGFGWQIPRQQSQVSAAIDLSEHQSGSKSLRLTFDGNSNPSISLASQTIIVKPEQRYRLNFAVKTKDLLTGGLPLFKVSDAVSDRLLGKSSDFPQSGNSWQMLSFEFTTLPNSEAIIVTLQRNNCSLSPCPIFGSVWLDSLSLEELN